MDKKENVKPKEKIEIIVQTEKRLFAINNMLPLNIWQKHYR